MPESMVRLHITPLNSDLLDAILGPKLRSFAQTVSYHKIETAPENTFGYVELPAMDATKVKKKLNGAILKGKKLKIEEAKPMKRTFTQSEEASPDVEPGAARRSKRTKHDPDVLPGHELSPERKVKRGWTEPKSERINRKKMDKSEKQAKSQAPSKHTEKPELLFRTKIPANKSSEDSKEKRKRSKQAGNADIVHEFEKTTTIPSFLRHDVDQNAKQAVEYKDGEGWVDQNGTVVEEESSRASKKRKAAKQSLAIDISKAEAMNTKRSTHQVLPSPPPSKTIVSSVSGVQSTEDETSSSGTSSPSSSASDSEIEASDSEEQEKEEVETDGPSPEHNVQDTTSITTSGDAVHPLEALFKKPKIPAPATSQHPPRSNPLSSTSSPGSGKTRPSLELSTSFSFFGGSADDDDDDNDDNNSDGEAVLQQRTPHNNDISHNLPPMPMTPFSTQDFRVRQIRSAAPTPDTGDIRKSTGYGSLILGEDDPDDILSDGEDNVDNKARGSQSSQGLPQSEFEKRFWEKRGENNRAWKARRRAVLKEQRQRENRARRPRGF